MTQQLPHPATTASTPAEPVEDQPVEAQPAQGAGEHDATFEHEHDDALADEWGEESFPSSDPPGHY